MVGESVSASKCEICELVSNSPQHVVGDPVSVALVPNRQRVPGNVLVALRRHTGTLLALSEAEMGSLLRLAGELANLVVDDADADGLHTWMDVGEVAGQIDDHVVVELVPRSADDGYMFRTRGELLVVDLATSIEQARSYRQRLGRSG